MTLYKCASQQDDNAIVISPRKFSEIHEAIRAISELGCEGHFKLAQRDVGNGNNKYLQIEGIQKDNSEIFRYFVEIETIFDKSRFPPKTEDENTLFTLNNDINRFLFQNFLERFILLKDESAEISFVQNVVKNLDESEESKEIESNRYTIFLKSDSMTTKLLDTIPNQIKSEDTRSGEIEEKYSIILPRPVFTKIFNIVKFGGRSEINIENKNIMGLKFH